MIFEAPAWLTVPALAAAVAALARLARRRPALRPLVGPFAALALLGAVFSLLGQAALARLPWLPLLWLAPLVVLVVRGSVTAFDAFFRRSRGAPPPSLLDSLVAVVLYAVGLGVVAHVFLGFELTPFLAGSAVVGAVLGLALQDALANLFAGIALHTEGPFQAGDWVRVGTAEGRVEEITWRALRLRTWDGDTLTLPNNEVARGSVLNFSRPGEPHSRVLSVGAGYQAPPDHVLAVLGAALRQVPGLPEEPAAVVRVVDHDDFAVRYEVRYFVRAYEDWRRVESEILRLVWYHFRRHGIEIPFPVRTVHLHQAQARAEPDGPSRRLAAALDRIDLFRALREEERRAAAAAFRHLHYASGERILAEGEPGDSFFLIDRGEVEVSKLLGGARRALARLREGQFFGEMALLTGEARAASVTAVTHVEVFTLDKAGFEKALVANPSVAVDISAILAERRDALSQAAEDAPQPAAEEPAAARKQRILARMRSYFGL